MDVLCSRFGQKLLFHKFHGIHIPPKKKVPPAVAQHLDALDRSGVQGSAGA